MLEALISMEGLHHVVRRFSSYESLFWAPSPLQKYLRATMPTCKFCNDDIKMQKQCQDDICKSSAKMFGMD